MINLNKVAEEMLQTAEERQKNGAVVDTDTRKMIKHCATEVVESAEAYNSMVDGVANKEIFAGEIADIICCCLIIAGKEDIDIERAIYDCVEKNERRANGIGDKL